MKAWDYDFVTYDGEIYCIDHSPAGLNHDGVNPIFASSEWDYYPSCDVCGKLCDYVGLTSDGEKYEIEHNKKYK
jgi:hypothetical protein